MKDTTWMGMCLGMAVVIGGCASAGNTEPDDDGRGGFGGSATTDGAGGDSAPTTSIGSGSSGGGTNVACSTRWTHFYVPGPDGVLGTPDDALGDHRLVREVDESFIIQGERYTSPGPDGQWDTSDDAVDGISWLQPDADDVVYFVRADDPGPDGTWRTGDDHVNAATRAVVDGQQRPLSSMDIIGAGPDGIWLTSDDEAWQAHEYAYGDGQTTPAIVEFHLGGAGPDAVWGTTDDSVNDVTRRFDGWGTFANGPGLDGQWNTGDDVLSGRYEEAYDVDGFVHRIRSLDGGLDGVFFTSDDNVTHYSTTACVNDVLETNTYTGTGPDGLWETPDDEVAQRWRQWNDCADPCSVAPPRSRVLPH